MNHNCYKTVLYFPLLVWTELILGAPESALWANCDGFRGATPIRAAGVARRGLGGGRAVPRAGGAGVSAPAADGRWNGEAPFLSRNSH